MHARRLYAHRGASAERPENTIAAFDRAVDVGADMIELDVRAARDGVLYVAHDPLPDIRHQVGGGIGAAPLDDVDNQERRAPRAKARARREDLVDDGSDESGDRGGGGGVEDHRGARRDEAPAVRTGIP